LLKLQLIKTIAILLFYCVLLLPTIVQANERLEDGFHINLEGYEECSFGSFNQLGYKITPLAQLYFTILQKEEEWVNEPSLYIKGEKGYVHLWKKDGTNVLYRVEKQMSGALKGMWKIVDVKREKINRIPVPKTLLKEALIERLTEPIAKAIEIKYKPRLWSRGAERILNIEKDEVNFFLYVTVQVETFEGAHNPPYGEETITFRINGSEIQVVDFKHRDIPKEEWTKLELRSRFDF
jgi:hypothetical protein